MVATKPLCDTCPYHENQAGRTNIMWGAGWVFSLIIGPITVGIILALIFSNTDKINTVDGHVREHERVVTKSMHEIENTLSIMSINQKQQMKAAGVEYFEPERVHMNYGDE
jgi:hypothetical protein